MPQAAEFELPPEDGRSLEQEIEAEIADHLALAANAQRLAGAGADEALATAQNKFGDVAAIKRRLWWIHQGDRVMLRTVTAAVLVILVAGLAFLAYRDSQMQLAFDERMGQLNGQLATLNETQRQLLAKLLEREKDKPVDVLEITGHCYLGTSDVPAAGAKLRVCLLTSDLKAVRSITTGADGKFASGPLPSGDYCVIASLIDLEPTMPASASNWIQSQPCYLYPGGALLPSLELDVQLHAGTVTVALSSELPTIIKPLITTEDRLEANRQTPGKKAELVKGMDPQMADSWMECGLILKIKDLDHFRSYWMPGAAQPEHWPKRGSPVQDLIVLPGSPMPTLKLDAGRYLFSAQVCAKGNGIYAGRAYGPDVVTRFDESTDAGRRVLKQDIGSLIERGSSAPSPDYEIEVIVHEDRQTELLAAIPEDYLSRLKEVMTKPNWTSLSSSRQSPSSTAEVLSPYKDLFTPQPLKLTVRQEP